jgi:hypothetical protein
MIRVILPSGVSVEYPGMTEYYVYDHSIGLGDRNNPEKKLVIKVKIMGSAIVEFGEVDRTIIK